MKPTIYPGIDGLSGTPSIFEYNGEPAEFPADGQALELVFAQKLENGVVALRYKFQNYRELQ